MESFLPIIFFVTGLLLGLIFIKILTASKIEAIHDQWMEERTITSKLQGQLHTLQQEHTRLQLELVQSQMNTTHLQEKLDHQKLDIEALQKQFKVEFQNLAQQILEEKSEKFTKANQQNIHQVLAPLKEKITAFEKQIVSNNETFIKENAKLEQQLKHLSEQSLKISEDAQNLTNALKGDQKAQGNWGEVILERVLEKSGLTKGIEYDVQVATKDETGKTQLPDVVINLPDDRKMIIDSKVSLTAYERYSSAQDKKMKEQALKAHIFSLKNHVQQLSKKKYDALHQEKSPDFVLLFLPIEAALYLAQSEDPNFFYEAFQQHILLVTPTTLLSTLRTVEMIWKTEKQQQNALEIAKHAGSLHDKFASLLDELQTLGNRIDASKSKYEDAMRKLTGKQNLIKDIQKLQTLGVSTRKKLD